MPNTAVSSATSAKSVHSRRVAASDGKEASAVEAALAQALQARYLQELADRRILRSIYALADHGVSQREIARVVDVSQPEVSRRLKRRELRPAGRGPREVILEARAGLRSRSAMQRELKQMPLTSLTPGQDAALDGAATSSGTVKELAAALREGLLSAAEYERIREARR